MEPVIGRSRNGNPCAWCLHEAGRGIISWRARSTGICERHVEELKAQIAARKARRAADVKVTR
jgi:hypothetical protein